MAGTKRSGPPRFVEMVRVSSSGQAARDTPEIQREALDHLRTKRDGVLVERIEVEGGISGAKKLALRPDLLRLEQLTKARAYDEIRVYHLDRLTRAEDPRERMAVLGMALDASAVIVDTSGREIDPADESGMGELDFYLNTWAAARERVRILKRTLDGRRRQAAAGRFVNGRPPFGLIWDKERSEWSLEPEHSEVVRRIFTLAIDGSSSPGIARILNAEGVPSPRKGRWSPATILGTLHNKVYAGSLTQRILGEAFETEVPAIVDSATWERAQAALGHRRKKPRHISIKHEALCRGRAVCGVCGASMHVSGTRGGKYLYYRCASRNKLNDLPPCSAPTHPLPPVDAAVWDALVSRLRNSDLILEAVGGDEQGADPWREKLERSVARLSKLTEQEMEVLHLRSQELLSAMACAARLGEIKRDRTTLEEQVGVAQKAIAQREAYRLLRAGIDAQLSTIRENLDAADFTTRKKLVEALVPDLPGYGITIHADGRIEIIGALDIQAASSTGGASDSGMGGGGDCTGEAASGAMALAAPDFAQLSTETYVCWSRTLGLPQRPVGLGGRQLSAENRLCMAEPGWDPAPVFDCWGHRSAGVRLYGA